jgi:hypothetical protein
MCAVGGISGVIAFCFASDDLVHGWYWMVHKFTPKKKRKTRYSLPSADVKQDLKIHYSYVSKTGAKTVLIRRPFGAVFTPRNRRIVKLWVRYGLGGIALLTPVLLSIPIGTFIATRLEKNRGKILLYISLSVIFWSIIVTSIIFKSHRYYLYLLQTYPDFF